MQIAIFSYSDKGCALARRIATLYQRADDTHAITCYAIAKFAQKYDLTPIVSTGDGVKAVFAQSDLLVFVGACGIAVRSIAPLLKGKTQDPACLVVDDGAGFVVPILSGHIGGANAQAVFLANVLGAVPVVTTATDVNQKFSVDTFATEQGFAISDMALAKAFSAQILTHDLPVCTDPACTLTLPQKSNGLQFMTFTALTKGDVVKLSTDGVSEAEKVPACAETKLLPEVGLYIGYRMVQPFAQTLRLVPKMLTLGIGCKKNTPQQAIETLVSQVLSEQQIDPLSICGVASIDLKAEEQGLLAFCGAHGYPVQFYTAETLQAVTGEFTPSKFVQSITGVDNVCERSALCAVQQGAFGRASDRSAFIGNIIVRKTACNGVTVAIASRVVTMRL